MKKKIALVALAAAAVGVQAADWSDTALTYRHGTKFGEPFEGNNITKDIIGLNHVSGYKYGTNFFNVDYLMSKDGSADPAFPNASSGAREIYAAYRNTVDLEKATGKSYKATGVRGLGVTFGGDYNVKNDAGYNSSKEMVVLGPTVMFDVPGFLNVSLLQLWESNSPYNAKTPAGTERYNYEPHPMLTAAWGIPFSVASVPLSFEGFANVISPKGKLESGRDSKTETNIDMQVMYDMSSAVGAQAKTFKVGVEYQFWKNKFGNDYSGVTGQGAFAKTPMVRAEYHF
jgi:nucleoside-specific outer membrane channel protein Tsx